MHKLENISTVLAKASGILQTTVGNFFFFAAL